MFHHNIKCVLYRYSLTLGATIDRQSLSKSSIELGKDKASASSSRRNGTSDLLLGVKPLERSHMVQNSKAL